MQRFIIGFMAALLLPLGKLYKEGIDLTSIDLPKVIGAGLPVIGMAVFVALYAYLVEKKEEDMKRLFRMCLFLPGFIMAVASGKSPEFPTVQAEAPIEIKCEKKNDFIKGFQATIDSLRNKQRANYYEVVPFDPKRGKHVGNCTTNLTATTSARPC